jgi:hypothetical protein
MMTMTSHRTRSVFERYTITGGSDLRDAAAKRSAVTDTAIVTAIAGNHAAAETSNTNGGAGTHLPGATTGSTRCDGLAAVR